MGWRLIRVILILPGTALVVIPGTMLWLTAGSKWAGSVATPDQVVFWLALAVCGSGLFFAIWTVRLFVFEGLGTPAPWDPPTKLVVRGPYRHVRNPMISSVLLMLLAESLLFQSWAIACWLLLFFVANSIYFPLVEEKGLEQRFGDEYRVYKANVPRWIPRLHVWNGA